MIISCGRYFYETYIYVIQTFSDIQTYNVEYCTNEGQKLQGYSIHIYRNIQCATDIIIKFVSCETYF